MKSVVFESTGNPDAVLTIKDLPEPEPKHGQVKVRMLCCPVNPSDLLFVRGQYTLSAELPATPGFEGVGVVESAGGGLRAKMMLGKRVAVLSRRGGNWAEKNVIPASQVIPFSNLLTGRLSQEQQATFFVNPVTAYVMCRDILRVPRGKWLLQTAAGSVLGHMIIRLGKRFGFRTLCVVRREEQVAELKAAGADAAIWFDPNSHSLDQFRAAVAAATGASTDHSMVHSAIDLAWQPHGNAKTASKAETGENSFRSDPRGSPRQRNRQQLFPGRSRRRGTGRRSSRARWKSSSQYRGELTTPSRDRDN